MSRVGKKPIILSSQVTATCKDGKIIIKGSKGTLELKLDPLIDVEIKEGKILVNRKDETKKCRALHGLYRSLINNMVIGVSEGFSKVLQIEGVGYKIAKSGEKLVLNLGFSHPVEVVPPPGISFEVGKNEIIVKGIDKCLVGQVAANIRKIKPVEPYKGKGIKYRGEYVRRKAGKVAKATGA